MARSVTSSVRDQLFRNDVQICLILKMEFSGKAGDVLVWNGIGDLSFNGEVYSGVGNLGGVSSYTETTELKANGMSFTLSGVPSSLISLALQEEFQQRRATLWLGFFDDSVSPGLLDDPIIIFRGRMDTMDIVRGAETSSVSISAESIFIALERAPMRRYMSEDHNLDRLAPTASGGFTEEDWGFNQVPNIQDQKIYWGGPDGV